MCSAAVRIHEADVLRATLKLVALMLAVTVLVAFTATADAAAKKTRYVKSHWKGYGFLPGYAPYEAARLRKKGYQGYRGLYGSRYGASPFTYTNPALPTYVGVGYPYGPYGFGRYGGYWNGYYIGNYYYGAPGFVRGQYNGGSMGPCWTLTPIGYQWNCGR